MADMKRSVVNGVNTISLHGKQYVEVAERVRLVYEQKREFEVLESSPFTVGDRCLWRVVVKVDGRLYTGNAEVKLNARPGSPDATNPFECGETSALGRALAFAGFGSVESIASFDEVYRATSAETPVEALRGKSDGAAVATSHPSANNGTPTTAAQPQENGAQKGVLSGNIAHLIARAKERAKAVGMATNINEWYSFIQECLGEEGLRDTDLDLARIAKINGKLATLERERQGAA